MNKLNIGCGLDYKDDYKNVDISKDVQTDECYDIQNGINEKDDTISEIFCGCMLEQIESNKKFIFVLNEFHRVLKKDGFLWGYVPSIDINVFCLDPMDRRFFTIDTFKYFDKNEVQWQRFGKSYGLKSWNIKEVKKAENGIIHFIMSPVK